MKRSGESSNEESTAKTSKMVSTSMVEDRQEIEARRFEYLDHPADVQIHAWGNTIEEAFEACLVAMFGYMTDLTTVEEKFDYHWSVKSDALHSLLFMFLDDPLNSFHAEPNFVAKTVKIVRFDREECEVEYYGRGDIFDPTKNPCEADIKSPTYSNMQIIENNGRCDIYVIVDI
ncbi:unnamed protein product [Caenorhabditis bovis]|uniref:Protein archease-like n=1 Tax=Caenorhabditis bovis TaxID=2654633 RepID=A0A8S1F2Y1_9PELO|nr:unnamed protein product [Caenorhabditis bovis]